MAHEDPARKSFFGFIGESEAMQCVYRAIEAVARSNATVFITGESGTGKELAAEAIHQLSLRASGPFVAINCGAIPRDLIASELFGHVKGSFTGAVSDRIGAVKQANGGTLFLDEICEMQIDLQTELLRFLQTSTFRPVGAERAEKVDLRVVCATNRDPLREVAAKRFREDLFYRLHVVPIGMPPLRDRGDDVIMIANKFMLRYAEQEGRKAFRTLSKEATDKLVSYDWPGNVRQLQNVMCNAVVMNHGNIMEASMLPIPEVASELLKDAAALLRSTLPAKRDWAATANPTISRDEVQFDSTDTSRWVASGDIVPLANVEKAAIERAIDICCGNIPRAAALLGVSPSTLYRKRQGWQSDIRAS